MDRGDWAAFLREYNAELLSSHHIAEALEYAEDDDLRRAVESGWLGYPGASDEDLERVDERLGVTLPSDYRAFLQASNGWRRPGTLVPRLWSVEELEWFRVTDAETIEIWAEGNPELGRHLRRALRISDQEIAGTAVYLLVPDPVDPGRGWRASMFAHWIPGERRYPSFHALLEAERDAFREQEAHNAKGLLPLDTTAQLPGKLTNLVDELRNKAAVYRFPPAPSGVGNLTSAGTAGALEEVAERVRSLETRGLPPEDLLRALRALQQEIEAEHIAITRRWGTGRTAFKLLLLVPAAKAMSRGEGLRQAAGVIEWFLGDV